MNPKKDKMFQSGGPPNDTNTGIKNNGMIMLFDTPQTGKKVPIVIPILSARDIKKVVEGQENFEREEGTEYSTSMNKVEINAMERELQEAESELQEILASIQETEITFAEESKERAIQAAQEEEELIFVADRKSVV